MKELGVQSDSVSAEPTRTFKRNDARLKHYRSKPQTWKHTVPAHRKVSRIPCRSKFLELRIRVLLDLISVLAFPDTCSDLNILSKSFAQRYGFVLHKDTDHSVRLPDGRRVESLGSLTLPMRYEGETRSYSIPFVILQNSVHEVVLGNAFLRITETFTKFVRRIEWFPRGSSELTHKICFINTPPQKVNGSINGRLVSASPDTGSDVNLSLRTSQRHWD